MAARKLQTEIDKTLKKVQEGVEIFEGIFEKIQASSNQTQKEKLESDLKTQIKKLQRLRDQIKTWMTSNDIKDKQPLIDNRKLIETQMERFKACEKEMKTKAFSKEGLNAATKLDPKEQQKLEMCQWIQTMVEELSRQVEQSEAEVEQIQSVRQKKKDSEREQRLEELEHLNERRSWHINRLELILRLLENGNLQTDAVTNVKDDIAYFVESNTEEDFEEDEGIYDELNLEDEEDMFQIGQDDHHSSHDSQSVADSEPAPPVPPIPKTPAKKASMPSHEEESTTSNTTTTTSSSSTKTPAKATPVKPTPQKKASLDSSSSSSARVPASSAAAANTTPLRSVSGPASSHPAPRTTPAPALPPIRYAAAAAAANANAATTTTSSAPSTAAPAPASATVSSPAAPPGLTVPTPAATDSQAKEASTSPAPSAPSPSPSPAPAQTAAPGSVSPAPSSAPDAPQQSQTSSSAQQEGSQTQQQQQSQQQPNTKADSRLPSSLADLVTSFESAKQKSLRREQDLDSVNQVLEAGLVNIPQPLDAEKPNHYVPRNPYATPSYYPQEPSSQFASPALFAKLDVDTLFYIFYYRPGTYLQYLAANELKKQSWRFHKQYLTWFQRANEPTTITDSYEQGVYLYFDWEAGWCQRRKHDFSFSYAYLEQ